MSQARILMRTLADRISALYQMEIIDVETRNSMAQMAQSGLKDNYKELYQYISKISNPHPLLEELRDLILFG